ncbi:MAG: hypothetical protein AB7V50_11430, partial [Vampirovibrionia bacterium]
MNNINYFNLKNNKKILTNLVFIFIFIFVYFFSYTFASATTYYVANTGNDSNNGTSSLTPWQTLNKVNTTTFEPGDSILFKKGDSWNGSINTISSGSSGSPIVYGSYGSGDKPKIYGSVPVV